MKKIILVFLITSITIFGIQKREKEIYKIKKLTLTKNMLLKYKGGHTNKYNDFYRIDIIENKILPQKLSKKTKIQIILYLNFLEFYGLKKIKYTPERIIKNKKTKYAKAKILNGFFFGSTIKIKTKELRENNDIYKIKE